MTTLFISGIDTDIGKTIACGCLANTLLSKGHNVFTQKWVETGVPESDVRISQDLAAHQRISNARFNTENYELHAPYLFKVAASPHLAAKLEDQEIDCSYLVEQTRKLESQCEHLLIEGAGGLCVPLTHDKLTVDLIEELELPIILVTSGKLVSINHSILSLEYCQQRNLEVRAIIYNEFPNINPKILEDSRDILTKHAKTRYPNIAWIDMSVNATILALNHEVESALLKNRNK